MKKYKGTNGAPPLYSKKRMIAYALIALIVVALTVALLVVLGNEQKRRESEETVPAETSLVTLDTESDTLPGTETDPDTEPSTDTEEVIDPGYMGRGIYLAELRRYSGPFHEGGTDEEVDGVVAAVIENRGEEKLEYITFDVEIGDRTAHFSASTVLPGMRIVVPEMNKEPFTTDTFVSCALTLITPFRTEVTSHEGEIELSGSDGVIYLKNITDADIAGDVVVVYKTYSDGEYIGGRSFMATLRGGLKTDVQSGVEAGHFSPETSRVMFIRYDG